MSMGRIADLVLRVHGAKALATWYCNVMGMTEMKQEGNESWSAKYPGQSVRLVFKVEYLIYFNWLGC